MNPSAIFMPRILPNSVNPSVGTFCRAAARDGGCATTFTFPSETPSVTIAMPRPVEFAPTSRATTATESTQMSCPSWSLSMRWKICDLTGYVISEDGRNCLDHIFF